MRKKIILLLAAAGFSAGLLVSCNNQLDDIFDKMPSERLDELVAEVYSELIGSPAGWVMEYYPNRDQSYGGVNILVKFNADNTVEMINETASDPTATKSSSYTINRSQGAVLAFDTDNQYISYYADPSVAEGEGKRYGFMGDLDFAIMNIYDDHIEMIGTKTLNKIILRKLPATTTWAEYLNKVAVVERENFYFIKYDVHYGDMIQELVVDATYPILTYQYQGEDGSDKTYVASYIYTDTGIKFYKPLELFGLSLQNFEWDKSSSRMVCTDEGATSAYLEGRTEAYFRPYDYFLGNWTFYCYNGSANVNYNITITEKEYEKSYYVDGFVYTSSTNGTFDFPFILTWQRSGRVEFLCPQTIGTKASVIYSTVTYTNVPVVLRAYGTSSTTTVGSGVISKTDLHENQNRVDFENNGVYASGVGFGMYYMADATAVSCVRFLETMYMVKN